MRLVTYESDGKATLGVVAADNTVVPAASLVGDAPASMRALIEGGPDGWSRLTEAAARASGGTPLDAVRLKAPLEARRNVFCVGLNYAEHIAEAQGKRGPAPDVKPDAEFPTFFTKVPETVIGPEDGVRFYRDVSDKLDWEAELVAVIGRAGMDIPVERALDHVFGYTCGNDISVRDVQRRHGNQWFKGKSMDTHAPMGPVLVTADELGDPHNLEIVCRVNGVEKQHSNTRMMLFNVPRIIQELSRGMRLLPGDIIMTGTPSGVGFARTPPEFMQPGDVVEVEIEQIGVLRNSIVEYPAGRD